MAGFIFLCLLVVGVLWLVHVLNDISSNTNDIRYDLQKSNKNLSSLVAHQEENDQGSETQQLLREVSDQLTNTQQVLNQVSDQLANMYVLLASNSDPTGLHQLSRLPDLFSTKKLRAWLRLQRLLALARGTSPDDADEAVNAAMHKWGYAIAESADRRIREECTLGSPPCPACSWMIQDANETLRTEPRSRFFAIAPRFIDYRCPIADRVEGLSFEELYKIKERIRALLTAATSQQLTKEEVSFLEHEGIDRQFIPQVSPTCD